VSEFLDDEAGSADKMVVPQLSEKALLATGIRIGTPVRTKTMEQFTARPRPDGLHMIDYAKTLHRIDVAGRFIAFAGTQNTVVYTSREHGAVAVEKFQVSSPKTSVSLCWK
jgi:small subunit ribosomal protein S2